MATISLGKNYTISGAIGNVSDLTLTTAGEKIDITTRTGTDPFKMTDIGLSKFTLEATVLAEASTTYAIGGSVSVTASGVTGTLICTNADRSEPVDGVVTYKLTLTHGYVSANTVSV